LILLRGSGPGETLGGLHAAWFYNWFYVTMLFVPEGLRMQGLGLSSMQRQKLMRAAGKARAFGGIPTACRHRGFTSGLD
jgi:hypothetical protein